MKSNNKTGFTLVELAIVMTIIGLLIGGILKGQELLENARVTSTLAQIKSFDASVTAFRDIYDGIPGDLRNAGNRIPGCVVACSPLDSGAANDAIGTNPWVWATHQATTLGGSAGTAQTAVAQETTLFWIHMMKASLTSGVTETALSAATPAAWGVTHPSAKIGGGWVVGFTDGTGTLPGGSLTGFAGNALALVPTPTSAVTAAAGTGVLTPGRAAQMDRKMDDGVPTTGALRAFGVAASCATGTPAAYTESITTKDCGILVKIQS